MQEVQTEVREGAYRRLAIHEDVPFVQVPANRHFELGGTVMSTRRSTRSAGAVATVHSDVRTSESREGNPPSSRGNLFSADAPTSKQLIAPPTKAPLQILHEREGIGVRISSLIGAAKNLDVGYIVVHVPHRLPGGSRPQVTHVR
jgi:hypothetical protein